MRTFCAFRYPPTTPQKGQDEDQPIRVTNKAMESLLFCIVYSIEFQSPLRPSKSSSTSPQGTLADGGGMDDDAYVRPVENTSLLLGGVSYVSRSAHNPSLLVPLRRAVETARAIPIPENSTQVHFELRVRVLRRQRNWLWNNSRPLVEWVFRMVKTSEEFNFAATHGETDTWSRHHVSLHAATTACTAAMPACRDENHRHTKGDGIVYSNDPGQIRRVLQFILHKSYEAIDRNTYADFESGELLFDISVQEVP